MTATALLLATVSTGLLAGVFGDWAHTIMPGLGATDDRTFVAAFHALDEAIMNPQFLLVFMGIPAFIGLAAVLSLRAGARPLLPWLVTALGLYLATFVITMAVHLPLNAVLTADAADPATARAAFQETRWVTWHVVRTVATTVAFGCLAWTLVLHGAVTTGGRRRAPSGSITGAGPFGPA